MASPAPPTYTAEDFTAAFLALLPDGPVWPKDSDATLPVVATSLMPTQAALAARAAALLADAPTGELDERLDVWEATLGLPDPCAGGSPTTAQRIASVLAKIASRGGQSAAYFEMVASLLGFTVTIQNYAPARFGLTRFGDRMYGHAWWYAWSVTGPLGAVTVAKFGSAKFGDRFRSWGNPVLECQLTEFAPAHTQLFFLYEDPSLLQPTLGTNFVLGISQLGTVLS